jgi:hypothetical protein
MDDGALASVWSHTFPLGLIRHIGVEIVNIFGLIAFGTFDKVDVFFGKLCLYFF